MQEKGNLSIHSENLFPIIKKWLYSDQDIFIRELVSNGVDAISKLKKLVSMGEASVAEDEEYSVRCYHRCRRQDHHHLRQRYWYDR